MARGSAMPAPEPLPVVSFEKVVDDVVLKPPGVHDGQARSYGYNDFTPYSRPEHYIRYIEPLESELAVQVEYDMDEQDQEWLDLVNAERKKDQNGSVSYETFEIIMDRLEKEWFYLTKNIPKPEYALPSEDSTCNICDDSEGENSNAIVFCDGCNLAVHQDCYGVPYIPEGQWLCRKCTVSPEVPVSCILCPNEGGAFKQTVSGDWAHLLCAIWIPETRVANDAFMEPITDIDKINKQRWKLKCSICDIREGACIQCAKASCFVAFHVTCARKEKLLLPMKSSHGSEAPMKLMCYCEKHLPREHQENRLKALEAEGTEHEYNSDSSEGGGGGRRKTDPAESKSARAYAKSYTVGPPLVPNIILQRILGYIAKVFLKNKPQFVQSVCKYWSMKREARRGAPLLKRLHLEPWTGGKILEMDMDDDARRMRLGQLQLLKQDLEGVRALAVFCRKRESRKQLQVELIYDVLSKCFFPHEDHFRVAFDKITTFDKLNYFKNPVTRSVAPDYFDVVRNPMCWNMIESKLDNHEYWDLQSFKDDIVLVLDNALLYNREGSLIYKAAERMKTSANSVLDSLDKLVTPPSTLYKEPSADVAAPESIPISTNGTSVRDSTFDSDDEDARRVEEDILPTWDSNHHQPLPVPSIIHHNEDLRSQSLGDLEPPISTLELLLSSSELQSDVDFLLTTSSLDSLFSYELPVPKPREPSPPPPPPKAKPQKRDRKAETARKKAKDNQKAQDATAGSRTRQAAARDDSATPAGLELSIPGDGATEDAGVRKPPSSRRSASAVHSDVPPMMDDVSSQGSFDNFNSGWILSEPRRRGRASSAAATPAPPPVDHGSSPPPKKRMKLDHKPSRLSVITTGESENQTLRSSPPRSQQDGFAGSSKATTTEPGEFPYPNDGYNPAGEMGEPPYHYLLEQGQHDLLRYGDIPLERTLEMPNGTVVVEQLDTPAIRKAKSTARKADRLKRQLAPGVQDPGVVASGSGDGEPASFATSPGRGGKRGNSVISDSDLTELSNSESEKGQAGLGGAASGRRREAETDGREIGFVGIDDVHQAPESALRTTNLSSPPLASSESSPFFVPPPYHLPFLGEQQGLGLEEASAFAHANESWTRTRISSPPEVKVEAELTAIGEENPVQEPAGPEPEAEEDADGDADADMDVLPPAAPPEDNAAAPPTVSPAPTEKDEPPPPEASKAEATTERKVLPPATAAQAAAAANPKEEDMLDGTLVWAKAPSYPWWPGTVLDPKNPEVKYEIPAGVMKERTSIQRKKRGKQLHLVRFFEEKSSWQWLDLSQLKMLGEDPELDRKMLNEQKYRNNAPKKACIVAYEQAMAEIGGDSDAEGDPDETESPEPARLQADDAQDVVMVS